MIDVRFFRKGHFALSSKEEARLLVREEWVQLRYRKVGLLFVAGLVLIALLTSWIYEMPFTPVYASGVALLGLALVGIAWRYTSRRAKRWQQINQLPDREQLQAARSELASPVLRWPFIVWMISFMLVASGQERLWLDPTAFFNMPLWQWGLYMVVVVPGGVGLGYGLWSLHCKEQARKVAALTRWEEVSFH
jgi:hypothetical protein